MEQLMVLQKHGNDRKSYVRTPPLYSMVYSPRASHGSDASNGRIAFPGHVIQLRCDMTRTKGPLKTIPPQPASSTTGRLKSARLLPMGVVLNGNKGKSLGIITAPSRASTMPSLPTRSSKPIGDKPGGVRRRVQSAIPSSRTIINIDDLLKISTTNVATSRHKALLHKTRLIYKKEETEQQQTEQQKDEGIQNSKSMTTIMNDIKVKVVHSQLSQQHTELPSLPEKNEQESKQFSKQSAMKKTSPNSKLAPLTGAYTKLPIGTLNGHLFNLTRKNKSS